MPRKRYTMDEGLRFVPVVPEPETFPEGTRFCVNGVVSSEAANKSLRSISILRPAQDEPEVRLQTKDEAGAVLRQDWMIDDNPWEHGWQDCAPADLVYDIVLMTDTEMLVELLILVSRRASDFINQADLLCSTA